jgi:ribosomal protein S18 acetylase RimI-like enzyme
MSTDAYKIRAVTQQSFERDLRQGPVALPEGVAGEDLELDIAVGAVSFYIAETCTHSLGRAGVDWRGSQYDDVCEHTGGLPNLAFIEVVKEHRGRGIGTSLVQRVLEGAKRREYPGVSLGVRVANEGARRLYERLDFRIVEALGEFTLRTGDEPQVVMVHMFPEAESWGVRISNP